MGEVRARGIRFNVHRMGRGEPTLVFIHGLVVDNLSSWFLTVAPTLARHCSILLYDLRGHGLSEQPSSGYSIEDQTLDLLGVLDAAGLADKPVTLVGNSTGGLVALFFARRFPERVDSLVLVDAHAGEPGFGEGLVETLGLAEASQDKSAEEVFADWLGRHSVRGEPDRDAADTIRMLERVGSRRRSNLLQTAKSLVFETSFVTDLQHTPPLEDWELASVTCPVLALYGEDSDIRAGGERLAKVLPRCRLEVVPGCGHGVLFQGTERLREALIRWVEEGER